jgi:hypothetical protein
VAIGYLMVAIFLAACARWAPPQVKTVLASGDEHHA